MLLCALVLVTAGVQPASAARSSRADYDWAVTLYRGVLTEATLEEMFSFDVEFDTDYTYLALAVTRKIIEITSHINFEGEGIIVKYTGEQDHLELDGLVSARWLSFPWNRYLDTTLAVGFGLSYATEVPPYEVKNKGESEKLLSFLMFELTAGIPKIPQWDLVLRINHRSGIFGTFNGMRGAMNSLALGLKFRF
jgi:hypothetical protein